MVDTFLYLGDDNLNGPPVSQTPRTQIRGGRYYESDGTTTVNVFSEAPNPVQRPDYLQGFDLEPQLFGWGMAEVEFNQTIPSGELKPDLLTGTHYDCWWDAQIGVGDSSLQNPGTNGRFVPYHPAPAVAQLAEDFEFLKVPLNPIGEVAAFDFPNENPPLPAWGLWQFFGGSCYYAQHYRFGSDVRLMRRLWKRYYPDPMLTLGNQGFRMIKIAQGGGVGAGIGDPTGIASWNPIVAAVPAGAGWDTFELNYDAAVAWEAQTTTGGTLDVKCAFIDISRWDISQGNPGFKVDVDNFVSALRLKVGNSTLKIIWLAHSHRYLETEALPNVAGQALNILLDKQRLDPNFRVIIRGNNPDLDYQYVPQSRGDKMEEAIPKYYSTSETLRIGEVMADVYGQMLTGNPAVPGKVIRGYISIGTSQTVGGGMRWDFTGAGDRNPIHGGYDEAALPITPQMVNAFIWDGVTLDNYRPNDNANSLHPPEVGTPPQRDYGGEITFFERQVAKHLNEPIALLKLGINAGSLNEPNDYTSVPGRDPLTSFSPELAGSSYEALLQHWVDMRAGVLRDRGETIDLQGIMVNLNDNETFSSTAQEAIAEATAFANKLPLLIVALRKDFTTRLGDGVPPIVLVNIANGRIDPAYAGSGAQMAPEGWQIIHDAVANAADTAAGVFVLDLDVLAAKTDATVTSTDGVHYTAQMNYDLGREFSRVIEANSINSAASGASAAATSQAQVQGQSRLAVDGVATTIFPLAFVVEDGTGLPNSTSYISDADADLYLANIGFAEIGTSWGDADQATRQKALNIATLYLDTRYGGQFVGIRASQEQALQWPRNAAYDASGLPLVGVPTPLAQATAQMAVKYLDDPTKKLLPDETQTGGITSESVTVGPISTSTSFQGVTSSQTIYTSVDSLLRAHGLISSASFAIR